MLVIDRQVGEALRIGDHGEVTVIVLGVRGNQVRIGIGAPRSIPVHRQEIFDRIREKGAREDSHVVAAEAHAS